MVAPPVLVHAMARAVGEEEGPVRVALRRLREAKLIDVFGRGRHAVDLPLDAAVRLLIGICGATALESDSPVKAVRRFELLPGHPKDTVLARGLRPEEVVLPVDELTFGHSFGEALGRLLVSAGQGNLLALEHEGQRRFFREGYVRVAFFLPVPSARIEHALGGWAKKSWEYGPPNLLGPAYLSAVRQAGLGGRSRVVEIDETALEILGRAITTKKYDF
jgi:hypothetical protein